MLNHYITLFKERFNNGASDDELNALIEDAAIYLSTEEYTSFYGAAMNYYNENC